MGAGSEASGLLAAELDEFSRARRSVFYPKADADAPDELLASLRRDKDAEAERNAAGVARWAGRVFGERPVSVAPLAGRGTFHSLYKLALPTVGNCVVRTSVSAMPRRSFDFHVDGWVAEHMGPAGVPVPRVLGVDITREIVPFDCQASAEAAGEPLSIFDLDAPRGRGLVFKLGALLARVHTVRTRKFGLLDVGALVGGRGGEGLLDSWEEYVFLNLDSHVKTCIEIDALGRDEADRVLAIFDALRPALGGVAPALLHGDLGYNNVFSDGGRITALIDWEDCLSGDPVFDIASWGTFVGNDARREQFLEGYRSARKLPEDFEARYWLYYLRVMLAKTVHRHRFRYSDRIPASLRLRKGLEELAWVTPDGF